VTSATKPRRARALIRDFSLESPRQGRVALVGTSGSGSRRSAGSPRVFRRAEGRSSNDWIHHDEDPRAGRNKPGRDGVRPGITVPRHVRDNWTLWDDTIRSERLIRARSDASVHWRPHRQPRRPYRATIAEGDRNLSGGQRKRLEIARQLVRHQASSPREAPRRPDPSPRQRVDGQLRRAAHLPNHRPTLSTIPRLRRDQSSAPGARHQRGDHIIIWPEGRRIHESDPRRRARPHRQKAPPVALASPTRHGVSTNGHHGPAAEPALVPAVQKRSSRGRVQSPWGERVPRRRFAGESTADAARSRFQTHSESLPAPLANGSTNPGGPSPRPSSTGSCQKCAQNAGGQAPGRRRSRPLEPLERSAHTVMTAGNQSLRSTMGAVGG